MILIVSSKTTLLLTLQMHHLQVLAADYRVQEPVLKPDNEVGGEVEANQPREGLEEVPVEVDEVVGAEVEGLEGRGGEEHSRGNGDKSYSRRTYTNYNLKVRYFKRPKYIQ